MIIAGVYAVVDLYGQCSQVTITSGSGVRPVDNHITTTELEPSISSPLTAGKTGGKYLANLYDITWLHLTFF
jgi:hypothetical protein